MKTFTDLVPGTLFSIKIDVTIIQGMQEVEVPLIDGLTQITREQLSMILSVQWIVVVDMLRYENRILASSQHEQYVSVSFKIN